MDNHTRCPGCFSVIENQELCSCGYDAEDISPLALPPLSLLNGQYLIGRVLGKPGGFGITYLGWDVQLETLVAVKEYMPRDIAGRSSDHASVYPHSREDNDPFRFGLEQFLAEARTLARFDHPNIVRIRSFFEQNQTAYLVMDYLKGKNISEHIASSGGSVSEAEAFGIMFPLLDGLREVHSKGILHRDIKPQNIYLTESGRPILIDFGAARQAMSDRSRSISVILTPGFAPYEQYHRRGQQGPWTDIYACAATLYFMLTGQVPTDVLERVAEDSLQPPRELNGAISQQVSDIIIQALAINPGDRPQDVFLFLDMLGGEKQTQYIKPSLGTISPTAKEVNIPSAGKAKEPQSGKPAEKTLPEGSLGIKPIRGVGPIQPIEAETQKPGFWLLNKRRIAVAASVILLLAFGVVYSQYNSTGTVAFDDGRKYVGDVRWGKVTGNGSMTYPDGRAFTGQFKEGVPNGAGALILAGGYRYEGTTNNSKRQGVGKLINPKQEKEYDGQWDNDLRNGTGTALLPDGSLYTGDFSNDKKEGKGKLVDKSGQTLYDGSWQNDQRNGAGQIWYADRSRYDGQIKDGLRQGQGKLFNASGTLVYEGEWSGDLKHGNGTLIAENGTVTAGYWEYGSYVPPRVVLAPASPPKKVAREPQIIVKDDPPEDYTPSPTPNHPQYSEH